MKIRETTMNRNHHSSPPVISADELPPKGIPMNEQLQTRRDWILHCTTTGLGLAGLAMLNPPALFAADDAETTAARLKVLKTSESLTAKFFYFGDQRKPFYSITYHLGDFDAGAGGNPFNRITKLDRDAMLKLLDALAKDGFIAAAGDISMKDRDPAPGYSLILVAKKKDAGAEFKALGWQNVEGNGHVELYGALGWNLAMIERLEKLQPALAGEAAKDMGFLLGRLTGLKREWQKAKSDPLTP